MVENIRKRYQLQPATQSCDLERAVESQTLVNYENGIKSNLDFDKPMHEHNWDLRGIQDIASHVRDHWMHVTNAELKGVIQPLIEEVGSILEEQLQSAAKKHRHFTRIVLGGGYANSLPLQNYIRDWLERHRVKAVLHVPDRHVGLFVSEGTLLRGANKSHGPTRIVRMSIGMLRHWPTEDPETEKRIQNALLVAEGHEDYHLRGLHGIQAEVREEGVPHVFDCVSWFVRKGDDLRPGQVFKRLSRHVFDTRAKDVDWIAEEVLYYSPEPKILTAPLKDDLSRPNARLGMLTVNLNELKPHIAIRHGKKKMGEGKMRRIGFYVVPFIIIIRLLEGHRHTLECRAEWWDGLDSITDDKETVAVQRPAHPDEPIFEGSTTVNITASFQLGTE